MAGNTNVQPRDTYNKAVCNKHIRLREKGKLASNNKTTEIDTLHPEPCPRATTTHARTLTHIHTCNGEGGSNLGGRGRPTRTPNEGELHAGTKI